MAAPTERLFLAIPLPEIVKESLAQLREKRKGFDWTQPNNLHLTLKFIGDSTPVQRGQIEAALESVTVRSFLLQIGGLDVFPQRGHPNLIYAGVPKPHPHLFALHQHINDTLFGLGIEPDRTRYIPHVTLARCREASTESVKQTLKTHPGFEAPPFFPDRYGLFRSLRGSTPPQYDLLWENLLTKA